MKKNPVWIIKFFDAGNQAGLVGINRGFSERHYSPSPASRARLERHAEGGRLEVQDDGRYRRVRYFFFDKVPA